MESLLQRVSQEPLMASALAVFFLVGVLLFRQRVRREQDPGYVRPRPGGGVRDQRI